MTPDIRFEKVVSGASGRYVARIAGTDGEAEIIFTIHGPALISAEHTNAPESMRGTGAAAALVAHMISDARANGFKIIPICPYVQAQYKRHPEADLFGDAGRARLAAEPLYLLICKSLRLGCPPGGTPGSEVGGTFDVPPHAIGRASW